MHYSIPFTAHCVAWLVCAWKGGSSFIGGSKMPILSRKSRFFFTRNYFLHLHLWLIYAFISTWKIGKIRKQSSLFVITCWLKDSELKLEFMSKRKKPMKSSSNFMQTQFHSQSKIQNLSTSSCIQIE